MRVRPFFNIKAGGVGIRENPEIKQRILSAIREKNNVPVYTLHLNWNFAGLPPISFPQISEYFDAKEETYNSRLDPQHVQMLQEEESSSHYSL